MSCLQHLKPTLDKLSHPKNSKYIVGRQSRTMDTQECTKNPNNPE